MSGGDGDWRGINFAGYSVGAAVLLFVVVPLLVATLCGCGTLVFGVFGAGDGR